MDRDVGRAVAVVVAGDRQRDPGRPRDRDVAAVAERHDELILHEPLPRRRPVDRDVHRAVAVVVARHRNIAGIPELHGELVPHEPLPGRRPIDRDVRLPVVVVVARHRPVARIAEVHGELIPHEPHARRRLEDRDIVDPVAVVVADDRHVAARAAEVDAELIPHEPVPVDGRYTATSVWPSPLKSPGTGTSPAIAPLHRELVAHEPLVRRRPEDGDVLDAVAVVVAGHRDVARIAELHGGLVPDEPVAGRRAIDRDVAGAIAVEVGPGFRQRHQPITGADDTENLGARRRDRFGRDAEASGARLLEAEQEAHVHRGPGRQRRSGRDRVDRQRTVEPGSIRLIGGLLQRRPAYRDDRSYPCRTAADRPSRRCRLTCVAAGQPHRKSKGTW